MSSIYNIYLIDVINQKSVIYNYIIKSNQIDNGSDMSESIFALLKYHISGFEF